MAGRVWKILTRRRIIEKEDKSELARVLDLVDLTALGVGATLGLGVYVLSASVAKDHAGPAVCISFLIAAIASAFAGNFLNNRKSDCFVSFPNYERLFEEKGESYVPKYMINDQDILYNFY